MNKLYHQIARRYAVTKLSLQKKNYSKILQFLTADRTQLYWILYTSKFFQTAKNTRIIVYQKQSI